MIWAQRLFSAFSWRLAVTAAIVYVVACIGLVMHALLGPGGPSFGDEGAFLILGFPAFMIWMPDSCTAIVVMIVVNAVVWGLSIALFTAAVIAPLSPTVPIPGFCRQCGYDLTGNTTGTCPECGDELTYHRHQRQR